MGDLLIERDRARGCIVLPVGAKGEAPATARRPARFRSRSMAEFALRSPQEPVGHANWLQKLSFAFLPCVSMRSRHIAIADTAARPSQGRRSRKVMIIVPVS